MSDRVIVHKNRTNTLLVSLGIDVSADTITSEIRLEPDTTSLLLATWAVTFASDGKDGELVLTMDDSVASQVEYTNGFMDLKRMHGGEPIPVFDEPLEVYFKGVVTV